VPELLLGGEHRRCLARGVTKVLQGLHGVAQRVVVHELGDPATLLDA